MLAARALSFEFQKCAFNQSISSLSVICLIQSASNQADWANTYTANNPNWNGPHVNFIASATELNIQGHDSSRAEIQDFRAEYGHSFPYVDDIDQDNMDKWGIPGTPAYFLIQPDGIVAWNSEDKSKTLAGAIDELTPKVGA